MPQNRKLMLLLNIVFRENNTASGGDFDREGKEVERVRRGSKKK